MQTVKYVNASRIKEVGRYAHESNTDRAKEISAMTDIMKAIEDDDVKFYGK